MDLINEGVKSSRILWFVCNNGWFKTLGGLNLLNKTVFLKSFLEKFWMFGKQLRTEEQPSLPFEAKIPRVAERLEPAALSEAGASLQTGRNRPDSV